MDKFKTGQIVRIEKNNKGLVIIEGIRTISFTHTKDYKVVDWIAFDCSNVSGSTKLESWTSREECFECDSCNNEPDYECNNCNGVGYYTEEHKGMTEAVILANNAKDYIMKCLTKNFDF